MYLQYKGSVKSVNIKINAAQYTADSPFPDGDSRPCCTDKGFLGFLWKYRHKGSRVSNKTPWAPEQNILTPRIKTFWCAEYNYFQGLKIYFQSLVIYFQGLVINFQALKIVLNRVSGYFVRGTKIFCLPHQRGK